MLSDRCYICSSVFCLFVLFVTLIVCVFELNSTHSLTHNSIGTFFLHLWILFSFSTIGTECYHCVGDWFCTEYSPFAKTYAWMSWINQLYHVFSSQSLQHNSKNVLTSKPHLWCILSSESKNALFVWHSIKCRNTRRKERTDTKKLYTSENSEIQKNFKYKNINIKWGERAINICWVRKNTRWAQCIWEWQRHQSFNWQSEWVEWAQNGDSGQKHSQIAHCYEFVYEYYIYCVTLGADHCCVLPIVCCCVYMQVENRPIMRTTITNKSDNI